MLRLTNDPAMGPSQLQVEPSRADPTRAAVGTILISSSLWSDPAWHSARAVLLCVSVAGAAAFLLLGAAFGHKHAPDGLYERIFLGLELFWIALAAGGLIRTAT